MWLYASPYGEGCAGDPYHNDYYKNHGEADATTVHLLAGLKPRYPKLRRFFANLPGAVAVRVGESSRWKEGVGYYHTRPDGTPEHNDGNCRDPGTYAVEVKTREELEAVFRALGKWLEGEGLSPRPSLKARLRKARKALRQGDSHHAVRFEKLAPSKKGGQ